MQQIDATAIGMSIVIGVYKILKANEKFQKQNRSPDVAPDAPVTKIVKAEGPDDKIKYFMHSNMGQYSQEPLIIQLRRTGMRPCL